MLKSKVFSCWEDLRCGLIMFVLDTDLNPMPKPHAGPVLLLSETNFAADNLLTAVQKIKDPMR